jgi:3-hydroxybutyryl-CoA dehydrogenase
MASCRASRTKESRVNVQHVAVAGTGMMGPGIAAVFAVAGYEATIVSRAAERAAGAVTCAKAVIEQLVANELVEPERGRAAQARLHGSTDLDGAARSAQLFVESIAENLVVKQDYFARLDQAAPYTILCSNTSGISITRIAEKCAKPERVLTTHFWNPPHLMPLVEVVMGEATNVGIAHAVVQLLRAAGKVPVLVRKDRPGQLGNRFLNALARECVNIVEEGIATPEDVDLALKAGMGLRFPAYGIFEHLDLVGLDLAEAVQDYVIPDLSVVQGAGRLLKETVARGDLGAKAGRGFLKWTPQEADRVRDRRDKFLIQVLRWQKQGRSEGATG